MKKILLVALIAIMTIGMNASVSNPDYVVTEDGVSYFNKIKYGFSNYLIGVNEVGVKIKFKRENITSYKKNGEVFVKKQFIKNGKPCKGCYFMKLIKTRHGFSLYTSMCYDISGDNEKKCFVFKGKEFVLEVNEKNRLQMINFFSKTYN